MMCLRNYLYFLHNSTFTLYLSIKIQHKMMEEQQTPYVSPLVKTLEIKAQAIICQSGGTEDYGNNPNPNWFGSN